MNTPPSDAVSNDVERVDSDVIRRLLSVAHTLETAKGQAFAIDFAQLAHDIRAIASLSSNTDEVTEAMLEAGEEAIEHGCSAEDIYLAMRSAR